MNINSIDESRNSDRNFLDPIAPVRGKIVERGFDRDFPSFPNTDLRQIHICFVKRVSRLERRYHFPPITSDCVRSEKIMYKYFLCIVLPNSLISKFSQYRTIICTLSVSTLSRIMISNLVFKKKRTFSIEIKWFVLHKRHITRKFIFYFSNSLLTRREESRTSLFSVDIRDNSGEK